MNIRIFVFQHTPCQLPACFADKSIYTPIQCGRAINQAIQGFIGDDYHPPYRISPLKIP